MLNTFFFGYLALKWRRLIRVLIILGFIGWVLMLLNIAETERGIGEMYPMVISMSLVAVIPVGLISWVVKPFIVKD